MRDKERLFSVRLHENFDVAKLEQACQALATNKSRLAQEGLEIVMNLHPKLRERLIATEKGRNYPVWAIIQTMIADYLAKYDAEVEVFGFPIGEFMFLMDGQGKPVDGFTIYGRTKAKHYREMERDKLAELRDKAEHGCSLSDDELAFLREQSLKALSNSLHSPGIKKEFGDAMKRQWEKDDEMRRDEEGGK